LKKQPSAEGLFRRYSIRVAGVGVLGLLATLLFPRGSADRLGALWGAGAAVLSGFLGIWLKRRMSQEGIEGALHTLGVLFGLRLLLVGAGIGWGRWQGAGTTGFVAGFFALYFVLQWLEISYVLAEQKRSGRQE
jgi:hypothetical protein